MPTSYTSNLRLALPANGELSGLWGAVVNDSITKMLEEAIAGRAAISSWVSNSHTLTEANGAASESRCAVLDLSGALTATGTLLVPDSITKLYVVRNNTTGGYAVTVQRVSGGAGVAVPSGRVMLLYTDGSNVRAVGVQSASDTAFAPAGTVAAANVQAAVEELDADIQGKQPLDATLTALAGVTVAADKLIYATGADTFATTDITAFARSLLDDTDAAAMRATLGLGSMAVQAANGVSISGGSIAGITDLAVADGGTGASTAADARSNLGVPAAISDAVDEIFAGSVAYFAASTAPTGWLKANGTTVSRTTYARLFSRIGTTFGAGDGSTTFNLPDLRGEFVRGLDDGRGVDTGRALGSAQADQMQRITGSYQQYANAVASAVEGAFTKSGLTRGGSGDGNFPSSRLQFDSALSPDARTGTETRPRNVALLACIKY